MTVEERKEYFKQYYEDNKEKIDAYQKQYQKRYNKIRRDRYRKDAEYREKQLDYKRKKRNLMKEKEMDDND